jgi:hypothetical protein
MKGYGEKLTHLEDLTVANTEQIGELKWWGRWIGVTLIAGVLRDLLAMQKKRRGLRRETDD